MWPQSVDNNLEQINVTIGKENTNNKEFYKRSIRLVEKEEHYTFHALMITSIMYVQEGAILWEYACKKEEEKRWFFQRP